MALHQYYILQVLKLDLHLESTSKGPRAKCTMHFPQNNTKY